MLYVYGDQTDRNRLRIDIGTLGESNRKTKDHEPRPSRNKNPPCDRVKRIEKPQHQTQIDTITNQHPSNYELDQHTKDQDLCRLAQETS